jgi:hypothetical protein
MEENSDTLESLIGRIENYGKTSYKLVQLRTVNKTAKLAATIFSGAAYILLLSILVLMANLGLCFWLGEILGRTCYGFFCVSGFYAVLSLILYFVFDDPMKERISNFVIEHLRK